MFETTIVGNHPKISELAGRPNLRLARNRFDQGKITAEELETTVRETIRAVISDQGEAGIDRLTDGRIRWDDPVTPFATAHDGFEPGGLIRFFDNNVYYRRPAITGPIRFVRSAVADDFRLARSITDRPLLASVCGPFSLAKFCVDANYNNGSRLYADCARLVRAELEALAQAGAEWVQLDEPYLGFCPDETGAAVDAITAAVRGVRIKVFVYVYFSPIASVMQRLWVLPVDMIGADCASVPANFDVLLDGPTDKGRAFGLVDARNTRLEASDQLLERMGRIINAGGEQWPACWLTPSAALEFLPHRNAVAKMRCLTAAVAEFCSSSVAK